MEGTDHQLDDVLPYVTLETAPKPYANYANALVAGVAAIRRMFGNGGPRS